MSKKVLSILMVVIMTICVIPVCAEETTDITVFFSLSKYGDIVKDKNGESMAYVEVTLSGKDAYNLDDVFVVAHSLYYEGAEEGYASSVSDSEFKIDKLWGDTSGNFGYLINGGTEVVDGVSYVAVDGDCIDAFIYKNPSSDKEGYSMFNMTHIEAYTSSEFELTLNYFSGYDDNIISPCEGATITINGKETDFVTDKNGRVRIIVENKGINIISATKKKMLNDEPVPAITAPVCIVNAKENPSIEIIHNIAQQYTQMDFSKDDVNLAWIIADMMIYEELFPESENVLNETQRQDAVKKVATLASEAEKPGDLAKYILALRALGCDAKNIYTQKFEMADIVKKLTNLVDAADESVTNIYTIPYVIIALSQGEKYATDEQIKFLLDASLASKEYWQATDYGTDALTPMILALAPYSKNDKVKKVLEETVEILKSEQREDGLIDGFEGYEPASTALAICALSAVGIDSGAVKNKNSEKSLIDGLISAANSDLNGFSNEFATEQGFRGLLAWRLLIKNKEKIMYDFSDYSAAEVNVPGIENCPVIFDVSPDAAAVEIEGSEEFKENCFDLEAGEYEYTVSASGYIPQTDKFEVTAENAEKRIAKTIKISLDKSSFGGGGGVSSLKSDDNADKKPEEETNESSKDTQTETSEVVFDENTFADVSLDDWYCSAVEYVYKNKLFSGTDKGFEPNESMTRAMLVTVLHRLDLPEKVFKNTYFSDVAENEWYTQGVSWAAENKIVNGVSDNSFDPNSGITREQLAAILYRYAVYKGYDTSAKDSDNISIYSDKDKISQYAVDAINYAVSIGVISGRTQSTIAPDASVTRAEVATMLMRFANVKN